MKTKHFELTSESKVDLFGRTLFRVKLTIDCRWGKKGTLGGWVEKAENLEDSAWVSDDAQVSGNAVVSGDAVVSGNAQVSGNAVVSDDAWVSGDAVVSGNAQA